MPAQDIQKELITTFEKWGRPKRIRIDNGQPLADPQRKCLSALTLWLTALDMEVILNRPGRPTDNASVERMQQTSKNWATISACKDQKQLQKHLDKARSIQRSTYKVRRLNNKTRVAYYPEILSNPRSYKKENFEPQKAYDTLAKWSFARKASKTGQFSLYQHIYYAGVAYAGQDLHIKLDTQTLKWEVCNQKGELIKTFRAKNMEESHLWNLTISQRTKEKQKK